LEKKRAKKEGGGELKQGSHGVAWPGEGLEIMGLRKTGRRGLGGGTEGKCHGILERNGKPPCGGGRKEG